MVKTMKVYCENCKFFRRGVSFDLYEDSCTIICKNYDTPKKRRHIECDMDEKNAKNNCSDYEESFMSKTFRLFRR